MRACSAGSIILVYSGIRSEALILGSEPIASNVLTMMRMQEQVSLPGCPPGLESLCFLDNVIVKQRVTPLEVVTGFEQANRYEVINGLGQRIMIIAEGER